MKVVRRMCVCMYVCVTPASFVVLKSKTRSNLLLICSSPHVVMEYVGKLSNLFTSVQTFYNELNPATLSGAIDIVVVKQKDGELACSPFHVRFGKFSLLMPQEKKVIRQ